MKRTLLAVALLFLGTCLAVPSQAVAYDFGPWYYYNAPSGHHYRAEVTDAAPDDVYYYTSAATVEVEVSVQGTCGIYALYPYLANQTVSVHIYVAPLGSPYSPVDDDYDGVPLSDSTPNAGWENGTWDVTWSNEYDLDEDYGVYIDVWAYPTVYPQGAVQVIPGRVLVGKFHTVYVEPM